ncbi:MAG: GrpB family protein [Acidobacteria bacterium]|nr:GrpB family protein [Acidobacteriota bacterium]
MSDTPKPNSWEVPPPAAPATDDYLASVTIGERAPLNARVELAPYDPEWPSLFELAAGRIRTALGGNALVLEHVGSTSVPGLSAKPIIDMVLAVANSADEGAYVPRLEAEGFVLRIREPEWFEHRMLLRASGVQVWQLHVFSADCEEIARMVAFRNWLRTHEADRLLYETTKAALAAKTWTHVANYADAKSEVVREILMRAIGSAADKRIADVPGSTSS